MTTRHERYKRFACFASEAERRFTEMKSFDHRARHLADLHSFYVRAGDQSGADQRWVTVFFGNRPVDSSEGGSRLLTEKGAALHYSQSQDGSVSCFIYPSRTENRQPIDEIVMLRVQSNPEYLFRYESVARDFSRFIAFAVWSGLDSKPSLVDKLRVNLALLFCRTRRDGIVKRHRLTKILKWIGGVALSGVGVYIIGRLLK